MPNIYQHINTNKRDTWVIIFFFIIIVSFIGWFIGYFLYEDSGLFFVSIALIFSGISSFFSYYNSDKIVLAISKARKITNVDNPRLHNLVENMSIASGIPKPRIYMIEDTAMNAFATGRDPEHGVICFTSGIVNGLDKRELEAVVAHEMSHIGNFDIRLMSIVCVLVGTITLLADGFTRGMMYKGRRRSSSRGSAGGLIMLLGIVFLILSPVIATLIKLVVSRKREFLADSTAVLITRYPQALADALKKLEADKEILEAANGATAHMYIDSPLKKGNFSALFATHPPIKERIKRLEAM